MGAIPTWGINWCELNNWLTEPLECCNCKIAIPVYKAGDEGFRRCTECGYSYSGDSYTCLIFLLSQGKDKEWKLAKVFSEDDWESVYRNLPLPRMAVYWTLYRGMQINTITFKEKLTLENVPWEVVENKFYCSDVKRQISVWLMEYYAGLSAPDDTKTTEDEEDESED